MIKIIYFNFILFKIFIFLLMMIMIWRFEIFWFVLINICVFSSKFCCVPPEVLISLSQVVKWKWKKIHTHTSSLSLEFIHVFFRSTLIISSVCMCNILCMFRFRSYFSYVLLLLILMHIAHYCILKLTTTIHIWKSNTYFFLLIYLVWHYCF